MSTDYESIAEQYKDSKHAAWRVHTEIPSFMRLVGDISGKSVLDLACGEGFYSREFMRLGAARVVGVDTSAAMVSLARASERTEPLGTEYVLADVQRLELGEQFDLVVAAFLLNYASDAAQLLDMCRAVARHSFDITVYYLDIATHEHAFAAAGLTDVHWIELEVSPQGRASFGPGYWETFVRDPPLILIECRAAASVNAGASADTT